MVIETGKSRPALAAKGISKSFGRLKALSNVDFDLEAGVCTGLIGPNGSGKSTLVNCLSGQMRPTLGSIQFQGNDVTRWAMNRRARHGLVRNFQNLRLLENLSVRENIVATAGLAGRSASYNEGSVAASARRFGLQDLLDARVADLSWGHRRRVELARVWHGEPSYMLLDEPGAGLDVAERRRLPAVIQDMTDHGVGTLLVDHDVTLISDVCTRVLVLRQGELIFDGTPTAAFNDPAVRECYLGVIHDAA